VLAKKREKGSLVFHFRRREEGEWSGCASSKKGGKTLVFTLPLNKRSCFAGKGKRERDRGPHGSKRKKKGGKKKKLGHATEGGPRGGRPFPRKKGESALGGPQLSKRKGIVLLATPWGKKRGEILTRTSQKKEGEENYDLLSPEGEGGRDRQKTTEGRGEFPLPAEKGGRGCPEGLEKGKARRSADRPSSGEKKRKRAFRDSGKKGKRRKKGGGGGGIFPFLPRKKKGPSRDYSEEKKGKKANNCIFSPWRKEEEAVKKKSSVQAGTKKRKQQRRGSSRRKKRGMRKPTFLTGQEKKEPGVRKQVGGFSEGKGIPVVLKRPKGGKESFLLFKRSQHQEKKGEKRKTRKLSVLRFLWERERRGGEGKNAESSEKRIPSLRLEGGGKKKERVWAKRSRGEGMG